MKDIKKIIRRIVFYLRVSTVRQVLIEEGSLKTQKAALYQRVKSHNAEALSLAQATGEVAEIWEVVEVYVEEGRSGTDARRPEYQRMIADAKRHKFDAVVCVALSRVSRSVVDFLSLIEILNENNVDFISLKEKLDSGTPYGRFTMTILVALAQLEAEIDGDRVSDSILRRSMDGLWTAGRIFGYDLNLARPGHLVINEQEARIVEIIYDLYLRLGSIPATVDAVNARGYRTKGYTSRRGKVHEGREFTFSTIKGILTNRAYLGQREVGKRGLDHKRAKFGIEEYKVVKAVWPAILKEEKFEAVQKLLGLNNATKHNNMAKPQHVFLLGGGHMRCDRCGAEMGPASGTGRKGKQYFYYLCGSCGLRLNAPEIESFIRWRTKQLLRDSSKLKALITAANDKLRAEVPGLGEQEKALKRELEELKDQVAHVLHPDAKSVVGDAQQLLQERLNAILERRGKLEHALAEVQRTAEAVEAGMIKESDVKRALHDFDATFDAAPPFLQKKLAQALIGQVRASDVRIAVGLDGDPTAGLQGPEFGPEESEPAPETFSGAGSSRLRTGGPDGI